MNLSEVKALLDAIGAVYITEEFPSQAAFFRHLLRFPYLKYADPRPVTAMMIPCPNGVFPIRLEFCVTEEGALFRELYFGEYSFEEFDVLPEHLPQDLTHWITTILAGRFVVICVNDLKHRRWRADLCFVLGEEGEDEEYQNFLARLEKPKSFWARLCRTRNQYDIYDSHTCRTVIK